jgi:hypothetical protein
MSHKNPVDFLCAGKDKLTQMKRGHTLEGAGYVFERVVQRTPFGQPPTIFTKGGNGTLPVSAHPAVPSVAKATTLSMPQGSIAPTNALALLPGNGTLMLLAVVAIVGWAVFYKQ